MFLGIIPAAMLFTACSSQDDSSSLSKNKGYSELVTKAEEGALDNPLFRGRAIYLRGEMNDYGVQSA